jgi:ABC-type dipeptide/oligopeptide/nickel transport system ATPase component
VGFQIMEPLRAHGADKAAGRNPRGRTCWNWSASRCARRLYQYPHQFSGGMRQRVMIAIALACDPDVLIADEPTTALDVTIQAQILELVKELRQKLGMAIIWITHDLGVIAGIADRVMVMYGGQVVEQAPVQGAVRQPAAPLYPRLLQTIPRISGERERAAER